MKNTESRFRIVGINFDHMHMGDLLRMVDEHPDAEIVGIADETPARMATAATNFHIPSNRCYTDYRTCLEETNPDVVILCPATADHAEWVERVAPYNVHILMEKPFAASLADADRMIAALNATGKTLMINWPLAWYPCHRTAYRLLSEGVIGTLREVHYYDGNRGPLYHVADKVEISEEEAIRQKADSWWYRKDTGGGSLFDYLGYGVTLGTWYHGGVAPIEVTTVVDSTPGLEVDEHSVTVARYATGLSKYETRWGTFTDPWMLQPQPKCGFVLVGTEGTIGSFDFETVIHLQTRELPDIHPVPVDELLPPYQNPIQYLLHCIQNDLPIEGPVSPALSRIGQQIVDAAARSAATKQTVTIE